MSLGRDPLLELRFDWGSALGRGQRALEASVPLERIVRPQARGRVVARFALPLSLCPTTNRTRHVQPWRAAKSKRLILGLMRAQTAMWRESSPLPGVPQVLCLRLSSVEPDKYSDWGKMAVDALCVPNGRRKDGLGLLRDDRPRDAEIWQWWQPAPKGAGLVYIEVRN